MTHHEQVMVRGIEVDYLLAPILTHLWDVPIRTVYSCQGRAVLSDGYVIEKGYIAYDAFDHEAMAHELPQLIDGPLEWELRDPYEVKYQTYRPGGTLWCVRFPPLEKADHDTFTGTSGSRPGH